MTADCCPCLDGVPPPVARTHQFLREHCVWHVMSRNAPVGSCEEAAAHRSRSGMIGIPLRDELKSLLFARAGAGGRRAYVLLHCRAHHRVDFAKVSVAVGQQVQAVPETELAEVFGVRYGTVTPVLFADRADVVHVVDPAVLGTSDPPGTMMTNAGDLEHAVEFRPAELFAALPRTLVHHIVADEQPGVPRRQPAGGDDGSAG